jgi:formate hydrogenlyase subunit 3/multisubunit Na+/H+ antiporter MnhD subunit
VAGSALGLVTAVGALGGRVEPLWIPWDVPYGSFHLGVDALSAWFLVPTLALCALAALYGGPYLLGAGGRRVGAAWLFYNLLVASMALVLAARNAVLFLVAWEIMSIASYFLVTHDHERESARRAGWIYLVASHLGAALVIGAFLTLGRGVGSLEFDRLAAAGAAVAVDLPGLAVPVPAAGLAFGLALAGFGAKAGLVPLHVWLPEAHPAAPSHVSAVMSGVMIKTGIYGLLRVLTFIGTPPAWAGGALVVLGLGSAVLGVLWALVQRDLKRLLAYSSVENVGLVTAGVGLGCLGLSSGLPALAALGFAGALLHVANHALFKGLLFMVVGNVLHGAGTADLERLGGLLKRMRWTGLAGLAGAAAVAGLPPWNGFASEFLLYLAALRGNLVGERGVSLLAMIVLGGLALVGALSAACFARAFGLAFLGQPREATVAHEADGAMRWVPVTLAAACLASGLAAPMLATVLAPAVRVAAGPASGEVAAAMGVAVAPLAWAAAIGATFLALAVVVAVSRHRMLARRRVGHARTWGCAYLHPSVRMQYSGSSFARPFAQMFGAVLGLRRAYQPPLGTFPGPSRLATTAEDPVEAGLYRPLFSAVAWTAARLRWVQQGRVQLYLLYVAITLLVLLIWKLGWR